MDIYNRGASEKQNDLFSRAFFEAKIEKLKEVIVKRETEIHRLAAKVLALEGQLAAESKWHIEHDKIKEQMEALSAAARMGPGVETAE